MARVLSRGVYGTAAVLMWLLLAHPATAQDPGEPVLSSTTQATLPEPTTEAVTTTQTAAPTTSTTTNDADDSGFLSDLTLVVVGGVISGFIAFAIATQGYKKAGEQWRKEQTDDERVRADDVARERARREADWIREATGHVVDAAQTWRGALSALWRETQADRTRLVEIDGELARLNAQTPQATQRVADLEAEAAADLAARGVQSQTLVGRVNQAVQALALHQHKIDGFEAMAQERRDRVRAATTNAIEPVRIRWTMARSLAVVLAPELGLPLDAVGASFETATTEVSDVSNDAATATGLADADARYSEALAHARALVEARLAT